MPEMRSLEVHARKQLPIPDGFDAREHLLSDLEDAIDLASDLGRATWLLDNGRRIAAIVLADVAERYALDYGACACPPEHSHGRHGCLAAGCNCPIQVA